MRTISEAEARESGFSLRKLAYLQYAEVIEAVLTGTHNLCF